MDNIGEIFVKYYKENPQKIAIIDKNIKYSTKELANRVFNIQQKLPSDIKGKVILILLPNSIEYIATYFAVSLLGGIVYPIYWKSKPNEIEKYIYDADVFLSITNKSGLDKISDYYNNLVVIIEDDCKLVGEPKFVKRDTDEIALLLQTSGTTNDSKIVAHSHNSLIQNSKAHSNSIGLKESDRCLITLPFPFGYCNTSQFLSSILIQCTIVIIREPILPTYFIRTILKNDITTFTAVPTLINILEKDFVGLTKENIFSVSSICFGGGTLSKDGISFLEKVFPNASIYQTYGQTEAGPRITTCLIGSEYVPENVGYPLENIKLKIVDDNFTKVEENITGQILVRSPSLMKGYLKNKNLDDNTIINGWLQTGDLGFIDEKGMLHITGRIKNIIKYSGYKIYPEEIEKLVIDKHRIKSLMLKGKKDKMYGEIPILYIEGAYDEELKVSIFQTCEDNLSSYKIPKEIFFVDRLSTTNNGKLKRI
ncbi:class I adenylate-forming enzyme family protein [Lysinibacillus sp. NPDC097231]|uniref:class I adenylate-forming enzyme family protein n=1 Tax=Lysinibacillus sp. NPDC097231 TaxID=3364142 RepID=UPI003824F751